MNALTKSAVRPTQAVDAPEGLTLPTPPVNSFESVTYSPPARVTGEAPEVVTDSPPSSGANSFREIALKQLIREAIAAEGMNPAHYARCEPCREFIVQVVLKKWRGTDSAEPPERN